jgi:teichuronic acid biosynthesis glycosyltransferase TuaH
MSGRVVVLSTADFDNEVWTNKQYIAAGLAESMQVIYIESLGLRAPKLRTRDLRRVYQRILRPRRMAHTDPAPSRKMPANLAIVAPRILPFHGIPPCRAINNFLMRRLAREIQFCEQDILWTFSPMTYGWENIAGKTVYHSVDLLHTIPGIPAKAILEGERQLIASKPVVIASSRGVMSHLRSLTSSRIELWENVASTELFASAIGTTRRSRAIFAGQMTPTKIDFQCFRSLLESGVEVAVAGQISADGNALTAEQHAIAMDPRIDYLGVLAPEELAIEIARSKVGLIPYLIDEHTNGIFPMKVYEYLAAGVQIVTTELASLNESDIGDAIRALPTDFGHVTRQAIHNFSVEQSEVRTEQAASHSWTHRIAQAGDLANELLRSIAAESSGNAGKETEK